MRSNGRASKVPSQHSWPPCHATKPKALWPLAWISATRRAEVICRFLPRRLPTVSSCGLLRRLRRGSRRSSLWLCSLGRDRCGYRPAFAPSKISKWHSVAFMGFNQRFPNCHFDQRLVSTPETMIASSNVPLCDLCVSARELGRKSLLLLIPSPLLFRWNQLVLSAMGVVVIPRVIFR